MVNVNVVSKDEKILEVSISGHANSDVKGKDLVCAGASTIAFGTLNALDEMTPDSVMLSVDNLIQIKVITPQDETCQIILKTMLLQFLTLEENYSTYIQVKQEVYS